MLGKLLLAAALVLVAIHGSSAQGCGGVLTAPPDGTVTSPNHPATYNNNDLCEWLITAPAGCTIRITFTAFDVESDYDFLDIFDGGNGGAPRIARLHGPALPGPITSTSNQLFVRFDSDFSIVGTGFSFTYEVIPCAIDIVLVLDVSSSIPQDQFELARQFMMDFVECAAFQGKDVRISVITYCCEAHTYFDLAPITMGMSYNIHYVMRGEGGITRTGHAIYYMTCTANFRDEAEANRVGVILTDGRSIDNDVAEAVNARAMGITLYGVSFGNPLLVDPAGLEDITADPFRVFDATQACDLAQKIVDELCGP